MEAFGIFEYAWVVTRKGHVKANPTPSFHQHAVEFSSEGHCRWPATDNLVILCKIQGSHLCAANARRQNNAARCKRELHFYCSVAPERLLNSLWKCWLKRSRFNKACSSGEEQQPTVRWGGWVWSYGLWILMMVQWSRYANQQCSFSPASAEKSGGVQTGNLCRVSTPHFFFFWSHPMLSPHCFLSQFCLLKCLPASPSTLPHLVLIHPDMRMSISDFVVAACTPHLHLVQCLVFWAFPILYWWQIMKIIPLCNL